MALISLLSSRTIYPTACWTPFLPECPTNFSNSDQSNTHPVSPATPAPPAAPTISVIWLYAPPSSVPVFKHQSNSSISLQASSFLSSISLLLASLQFYFLCILHSDLHSAVGVVYLRHKSTPTILGTQRCSPAYKVTKMLCSPSSMPARSGPTACTANSGFSLGLMSNSTCWESACALPNPQPLPFDGCPPICHRLEHLLLYLCTDHTFL